MESILIVLAIILSIFLGEKFNINTGLIALAFAYLIGCFVLGMSIPDFLATWPTKLFLVIFSVSLFFNFAVVNGTLDKLANLLLYKMRRFSFFLPLIIYFITALVSGLGAGFFTSIAIMGTISMALCKSSNMNRMYASIAVSLGALSGANFMFSAHGVLFNSLLTQTPLADQAASLTQDIFIVSFIYPIFVVLILLFFSKRKSDENNLVIEKPEVFNKKQKINLILIASLMVIVLFVPALNNLFPNKEWLNFINTRIDISLLAIVFAIICYFLKLTDTPDKVMEKIPWSTIWLVCGVGMLIDVAVEAGTIDLLASFINKIPTPIVPVAVCIIAGVMSIFSSTLGVVAPLMFPMVSGIAISTGFSPALIIVSIIIGAQSTALAPFSTGGSLILGNSGLTGKEQEKFYNKLLYVATPLCLAFAVIATFILTFIY
ncbi:SLC13 family permease [Enterococcus sp. LJL90]